MRPFRRYLILASITVLVFVLVLYYQQQSIVKKYETKFNDQQALQTNLGAQGIRAHFNRLQLQIELVGSQVIPLYLNDELSPATLESTFMDVVKQAVPDIVAFDFYTDPQALEPPISDDTPLGEIGRQLLLTWVIEYWDEMEQTPQVWVTPFQTTEDHVLYGLLQPVWYTGQLVGVLAAVVDFSPMIEQYVIPLRTDTSSTVWVQDGTGRVLYYYKAAQEGANGIDLSADDAGFRPIVSEMLTQDEGQGAYRFPAESGGGEERKLVAWSTVTLANQRLTVALAAPESESGAEMRSFRRQSALLGLLFGITLVGSGGLFYLTRQRVLEKLVKTRTQQLQELNNSLERLVSERAAEVMQERAQLRAILDAMGDGVVYAEHDEAKYMNRALATLLGYSPEELTPQKTYFYKEVVSAERSVLPRDYKSSVATRDDVWRGAIKLCRKDGTAFDAGLTIAPVRDPAGEVVGKVVIIRDISLEKALQAQKDRFISHASHELRTPVSNLKTRLYLLQHQPEKLAEHLRVMQSVTDYLVALVQDMLDVDRFERGVIELHRRPLCVQDVIKAVITAVQPEADEQKVTLGSDLPDAPVMVMADPSRLRQTITNLINNAIHCSSSNGEARVRLTTEHDGGGRWAVIRVQDSGPGIPHDGLAQVFEPFFRASEGHSPGTGLELTIAKQIVEQHGGSIQVAGHPTDGNMFTVRLPLADQVPETV